MSKQYLIEHSSCEYSSNGMEFKVKNAKQVEVLDAKEISLVSDGFLYSAEILSDYLAANNLQIIKTVK